MKKTIEFSPKQLEYINKATHRYNGKIGATQCGKTHVDISFVILDRITERKGKKGLNLILGVSKETIERNVLEPMRDVWGEDNITSINNRNLCYIFGEKVYCLGAEKVSQVAKLRGAKFKYVYVDELVDIHKEVFELLKSRLSLDYSVCDFTGNPSYPSHWAKSFIDSDVDIYCQQWTLYDNPFLSPKIVESLERDYKGTVYFQRYILGQWINAEGLIYKAFDKNIHVVSEDKMQELIKDNGMCYANTGVDFGGNKSASVFSLTGFSNDFKKVFALDEYYDKENKSTEHLINAFKCKVDHWKEEYHQLEEAFCDNAEQLLVKSFRIATNKIDVRNARKMEVNERIFLLNILLNRKQVYISEKCKHLIEAIETAMYNEKIKTKDERLDDGTTNIDSLDAFEYSIERYYRELLGY